jgi:hypothetical protein
VCVRERECVCVCECGSLHGLQTAVCRQQARTCPSDAAAAGTDGKCANTADGGRPSARVSSATASAYMVARHQSYVLRALAHERERKLYNASLRNKERRGLDMAWHHLVGGRCSVPTHMMPHGPIATHTHTLSLSLTHTHTHTLTCANGRARSCRRLSSTMYAAGSRSCICTTPPSTQHVRAPHHRPVNMLRCCACIHLQRPPTATYEQRAATHRARADQLPQLDIHRPKSLQTATHGHCAMLRCAMLQCHTRPCNTMPASHQQLLLSSPAHPVCHTAHSAHLR